ncbi:hypothetical protein GGR56DRAFT_15776 [Xylariaceae sp. FL0804]|nr:hypothetical protein GGR56DRAFT_15776 [Xylariaceae sp. FL0804]
MPPHIEIADSDDEDGPHDEPPSPHGHEVAAPEPEALSPHHQPSSSTKTSDPSDHTDQSFFARVYDARQQSALQQSRLIENIVRQSQRASTSSGDVSLPAKGGGRKTNSSSATDLTSPIVLIRQGNRQAPFGDDDSEFTTPKKSARDEWDVPSSAEGAPVSSGTRSSRSNRERTDNKRKRNQLSLVTSPAAADLLAADNAAPIPAVEGRALQEHHAGDSRADLPSFPAEKKRRVSLHDSAIPENRNFYVAQSSLTTMQKLEYQRVNVSSNPSAGPQGSINQKSSGATTIAYPTPSIYASPGLPPPWERPSDPVEQPDTPQPIDITSVQSSPDVISADHMQSRRQKSVIEAGNGPLDDGHTESPAKLPSQTQSTKKKRKKVQRSTVVSEEPLIGQDDAWDSDEIKSHRESYKPRPTKRRLRPAVPGDEDGEPEGDAQADGQAIEDIRDDTVEPTSEATQEPTQDPHGGEVQSTNMPKKRGRKKKQTTTDRNPKEINVSDIQEVDQALPNDVEAVEHTIPAEKPKKKRGRPRKSEMTRLAEEATVQPPRAAEVVETRETDDELAEQDMDETQPTKKKQKKSEAQAEEVGPQSDTPNPQRKALALEEVDANTRSPTVSRASDMENATPAPESRDKKKTSSKSLESEAAAKSAAVQSRTPYRVGLSKRSRIAPLLKSIRK